MKRLLIFDAYGTLFSTGTGSVDAARRILALQEKDIDAACFYKEWKKLHRLHLDEANASVFIAEKAIFAKDLKVLYDRWEISRDHRKDVQIMLDSLHNRRLFPEVKEAIRQLRRTYRFVIGSTTDTAPLMQNMAFNDFTVDAVYTSEIIGKYKPDRYFYEYILNSENCAPDDAVFIGDSLTDDVAGPQGSGIKTVLVDRGRNAYSFENVRPDHIVKSIDEIENIISA